MILRFSIWLGSKTRWAHLEKDIEMEVIPRVGEFVKFNNAELGDYFSWRVSEIIYRESGEIEVQTELLNDIDDRGYSFEEEKEFDEYHQSYVNEGWVCSRGVTDNNRVKDT